MNHENRPSYRTYRPLLLLAIVVLIHFHFSLIDWMFDMDTSKANIRYYGYSAFAGGGTLFYLFSLTRKLFRDG